MKRAYAALTAALLALLFVVPVGAQDLGPEISLPDVYPGADCNTECVDLIQDGNPLTGCDCWNISWCTSGLADKNFAFVRLVAQWPDGFVMGSARDGMAMSNARLREPQFMAPNGERGWYSFTNFGSADCITFAGRNDLGTFGSPMLYEVTAYEPQTGRHIMPIEGDFWQVRAQVGNTLGTEIVSNFIYVIMALILGAMGLTMVIRGLFGQTGVGKFHHGSGMAQRGSGLAHKGSGLSQREVGDVD